MMRHSVNNNTRMGLVIYLLNSNQLISFIPPKLPQILDIYSVVALYKESFVILDINKDKIKSNCFLLSISKPYSGKAVITAHNDLYN